MFDTETLPTFSALVFTAVNIHMLPQVMLGSKTFLTLSTWVQLISSMCLFVTLQMSFRCKPFVTHCTQIRSWLAIMWMLSDIITISFNLHLKWTFTCTACTTCKQNHDSQNKCALLKEIKCEGLFHHYDIQKHRNNIIRLNLWVKLLHIWNKKKNLQILTVSSSVGR